MRRLLIITVTLCLLTLSASAWAGSDNHRIPPGQAKHMATHRTVAQGQDWGHKTARHSAHQEYRPGLRYGQRHHHRVYVAQRCAPVHRRPVVVRQHVTTRSSVQEFTISIRTTD
ncbi:hypothetical protein [uncultured Pseudodesulfovibrio sp.]|uniref:hypothetical protein n=1 Tax=uncultured Pseudodesulfovibrio sp. TaxID=2035858 RepID=UPI0029C861E8|nr:hypothetical protein [uncultured Pseudodesulfovibrio sp.]